MSTAHRVVLIEGRISPRAAMKRFPSNPFFDESQQYAYHGFAIDERGRFASHVTEGLHKWIRGSAQRPPIVFPRHSHPISLAVARASLARYFEPMQPKVTPFKWDGILDLPCGLGDFGPRARVTAPSAASVVLPRVRLTPQDPSEDDFVRLDFPEVHWTVSMPKCYRIKVLDWKRTEPEHTPTFEEELELAMPPSALPPASWWCCGLLLRETLYFELRDAFPPTYFDIKPQAE
jgi:hypothetical protein